MSRVRTPALALASIAAAAAALAACSSSGTSATSTPPTTPSSSTSSIASSPAAATGSAGSAADTGSSSTASGSSGSSGSRSSSSACAESQLWASVTPDDIPSLGYHVLKINFKNTSSSTCTLTGFPGAAIEDSSNHQVQQAKRVVGGPVGGTIEESAGTTPVAPGATVFAYLAGQSTQEKGAAQAGCEGAKYPRILVTPPNTRTPIPFSIGWPQCYSFDIHPVRSQ